MQRSKVVGVRKPFLSWTTPWSLLQHQGLVAAQQRSLGSRMYSTVLLIFLKLSSIHNFKHLCHYFQQIFNINFCLFSLKRHNSSSILSQEIWSDLCFKWLKGMLHMEKINKKKKKFPKLIFFLEHFKFRLSVRVVLSFKPVSKVIV